MNLWSSHPILSLSPINNVTPTLKRCHWLWSQRKLPADTEQLDPKMSPQLPSCNASPPELCNPRDIFAQGHGRASSKKHHPLPETSLDVKASSRFNAAALGAAPSFGSSWLLLLLFCVVKTTLEGSHSQPRVVGCGGAALA